MKKARCEPEERPKKKARRRPARPTLIAFDAFEGKNKASGQLRARGMTEEKGLLRAEGMTDEKGLLRAEGMTEEKISARIGRRCPGEPGWDRRSGCRFACQTEAKYCSCR